MWRTNPKPFATHRAADGWFKSAALSAECCMKSARCRSAKVSMETRCNLLVEWPRLFRSESRLRLQRAFSWRLLFMRNRPFTFTYGAMLILGMAGLAVAQDNGAQQPSARQQLQHIHTPESIDEKLAQ